jgi:hypothetical protein
MTSMSTLPGCCPGPTYCTLRTGTEQASLEGMLQLSKQYPVAERALPLSGAA